MKKNKFILALLFIHVLSTSFLNRKPTDGALAAYEVRCTFTGYIPSYGGTENCRVNELGKAVISGILEGNENTGDAPVLYRGTLQISINIDICSVRRDADGEDRFCTMTVKGNGPVKTELEIDAAAGYGYMKINYIPSLGKFTRSVQGTCDANDMVEEQKMVPNDTEAAIFNGVELPMLKERTLSKKKYQSHKSAEGVMEVEVLRKLR